MSASVVTYKGRENFVNAINNSASVPKYVSWGTNVAGADGAVAQKWDVNLFAESAEARTSGATSIVTTTTTNDTFQVVGTVTATASRAICECALFDSATQPHTDTVQTSSGIISSSSGTTVIVGTGSNFTNSTSITVANATDATSETMAITGITSNTLTVTRAANGSTALSHFASGNPVSQGNIPGSTTITGGNCIVHADFAVINLNNGDSIQFTIKVSLS